MQTVMTFGVLYIHGCHVKSNFESSFSKAEFLGTLSLYIFDNLWIYFTTKYSTLIAFLNIYIYIYEQKHGNAL